MDDETEKVLFEVTRAIKELGECISILKDIVTQNRIEIDMINTRLHRFNNSLESAKSN